MLELIIQGFIEWIYGLILDAWEFFSDALLDIVSMDLAYLKTHMPVINEIMEVMLAIGWAFLIGNLVFQALRSMTAGLGFEGEDPKLLFTRTFVFAFLLLASPQICQIGLDVTAKAIELLKVPTAVVITFPEEGTFNGIASAWLLVIISGFVLMFKVLKLLLEIAERYLILAVLSISAPLAFGIGGSKNTADIFSGWCRMFGSMCLVMMSNIVFMKMLFSILAYVPSGIEVLPWMVMVFAVVKVAHKIDSIITRIGLNPAITGDGAGRSFPGMLAYTLIRSAAQRVISPAGKSSGGSGRNSTPNTPPGGGGGSGRNPFFSRVHAGGGTRGTASGAETSQNSEKPSNTTAATHAETPTSRTSYQSSQADAYRPASDTRNAEFVNPNEVLRDKVEPVQTQRQESAAGAGKERFTDTATRMTNRPVTKPGHGFQREDSKVRADTGLERANKGGASGIKSSVGSEPKHRNSNPDPKELRTYSNMPESTGFKPIITAGTTQILSKTSSPERETGFRPERASSTGTKPTGTAGTTPTPGKASAPERETGFRPERASSTGIKPTGTAGTAPTPGKASTPERETGFRPERASSTGTKPTGTAGTTPTPGKAWTFR